MGETLPGYELSVWYGLFGPLGLPGDLVERLNAATNQAMSDPAVKARLAGMGVDVIATTSTQFTSTLRRDADKYGRLIRELGIKGE